MRKIYILKTAENSDYTVAEQWAAGFEKAFSHAKDYVEQEKFENAGNFAEFLEEQDASMLIITLLDRKEIQKYLNICRELRIPYLFVFSDSNFNVEKAALPITFLIEDREKAPFASALGRFCNSEIAIYAPKDYGSKARENINAAKTLFNSFSLNYTEKQGKKDSFGIEKEAVAEAKNSGCSLVIISASREYGLDDVIFGSKEKKILKTAEVPVLLINPRADLYTLCD
jgi:nucleotide-binding universal stress UspA family protein